MIASFFPAGVMVFIGVFNLSGYVNATNFTCTQMSSTTSLPWLLTYVAACLMFGAAIGCVLQALVKHTGSEDDGSKQKTQTKMGLNLNVGQAQGTNTAGQNIDACGPKSVDKGVLSALSVLSIDKSADVEQVKIET